MFVAAATRLAGLIGNVFREPKAADERLEHRLAARFETSGKPAAARNHRSPRKIRFLIANHVTSGRDLRFGE
jgi:hypothetical protein